MSTIIASLTSTPVRIGRIGPAITSLMRQTRRPDLIVLGLPVRKTADSTDLLEYRFPTELAAFSSHLVVIWLKSDFGPVCKLLGGATVGTGSDVVFRYLLASADDAGRCQETAMSDWPDKLRSSLTDGIHSESSVLLPTVDQVSLMIVDDDIEPHPTALAELIDRAKTFRIGDTVPAVGFGGAKLGRIPPFFRVQRTTAVEPNYRIKQWIEFGRHPGTDDRSRIWSKPVDWLLGAGVALYPLEYFGIDTLRNLADWSADPMMRRADDVTIGAALSLQNVPRLLVFPDRPESVVVDRQLPGALSEDLYRAFRCHLHAFTKLRDDDGAFSDGRFLTVEIGWFIWTAVTVILLLILFGFLFRFAYRWLSTAVPAQRMARVGGGVVAAMTGMPL